MCPCRGGVPEVPAPPAAHVLPMMLSWPGLTLCICQLPAYRSGLDERPADGASGLAAALGISGAGSVEPSHLLLQCVEALCVPLGYQGSLSLDFHTHVLVTTMQALLEDVCPAQALSKRICPFQHQHQFYTALHDAACICAPGLLCNSISVVQAVWLYEAYQRIQPAAWRCRTCSTSARTHSPPALQQTAHCYSNKASYHQHYDIPPSAQLLAHICQHTQRRCQQAARLVLAAHGCCRRCRRRWGRCPCRRARRRLRGPPLHQGLQARADLRKGWPQPGR